MNTVARREPKHSWIVELENGTKAVLRVARLQGTDNGTDMLHDVGVHYKAYLVHTTDAVNAIRLAYEVANRQAVA